MPGAFRLGTKERALPLHGRSTWEEASALQAMPSTHVQRVQVKSVKGEFLCPKSVLNQRPGEPDLQQRQQLPSDRRHDRISDTHCQSSGAPMRLDSNLECSAPPHYGSAQLVSTHDGSAGRGTQRQAPILEARVSELKNKHKEQLSTPAKQIPPPQWKHFVSHSDILYLSSSHFYSIVRFGCEASPKSSHLRQRKVLKEK